MDAWEQLPGEPEGAYSAFALWLHGPRRTPRARRPADAHLRERWGWAQRAAAWDQHVAAQRAALERALAGDLVRAQLDAYRGVARVQGLIADRIEALDASTLDLRELRDLSLVAKRSVETAAALALATEPADVEVPSTIAAQGATIAVSELSDAERERLADRIVAAREL